MTNNLIRRPREQSAFCTRQTNSNRSVAAASQLIEMTSKESNRARFGPFEVDLHTHELWKHGTRLKLVGQPFEILAMLLSRPGELVTRDEMRARLWPSDTFVDFNHGLNAAVNKLREALSDSAENPRYIETLPRRGYRFVAEIEWVAPRSPATERPATLQEEPEPAAIFGTLALLSILCARSSGGSLASTGARTR